MSEPWDRDLARRIDHTLLRPDASRDDILRLCDEAAEFGFAAVCVQPCWVSEARRRLGHTSTAVAAVVSFPHGAAVTRVKTFEALAAVADGASELDMVARIDLIRARDRSGIEADVAAVVGAVAPVPVKVILETSMLDTDQKRLGAAAAVAAGARFLKTSTGFGGGGATEDDVRLLRGLAPPTVGVKASGGIRTRAQGLAMMAAGASRLGTSAGVALVTQG